MEFFIDFISHIGIMGLILVMAMEGLSIPIPGIVVVLTLGHILDLKLTDIVLISISMSAAYTAASWIPYMIGFKFEMSISSKYKKGIDKASSYFNRYGEYSIALLRPFAVGNYISYIAGIAKVKPIRYILLTFFGIFPWSFLALLAAHFSRGNIKRALDISHGYAKYIYLAAIIVGTAYTLFVIFRIKRIKKNKF